MITTTLKSAIITWCSICKIDKPINTFVCRVGTHYLHCTQKKAKSTNKISEPSTRETEQVLRVCRLCARDRLAVGARVGGGGNCWLFLLGVSPNVWLCLCVCVCARVSGKCSTYLYTSLYKCTSYAHASVVMCARHQLPCNCDYTRHARLIVILSIVVV